MVLRRPARLDERRCSNAGVQSLVDQRDRSPNPVVAADALAEGRSTMTHARITGSHSDCRCQAFDRQVLTGDRTGPNPESEDAPSPIELVWHERYGDRGNAGSQAKVS